MSTTRQYVCAAAFAVVAVWGFAACGDTDSADSPSGPDSGSYSVTPYPGLDHTDLDSNGNGRWDPSPLDPYQS